MSLAIESIILERKKKIDSKKRTLARSLTNKDQLKSEIRDMEKDLEYFQNKQEIVI